ncbi:FimV/HubP family polar landmark protein, partial [uncultured Psychrosphaera sp.]|uniref:FimV/HubP family polar landmark protein n=1 Tax=uncultured Psychrosphaera sp. TaxID=1403522 RepID=UPI0030F561F4
MRLSLKILIVLIVTSIFAGQTFAKSDSKLRGPKGVDYGAKGVQYGPISKQDTMWKLGNKFRFRNDVTVHQVMIAILKKNPNAFEFDNLNGLYDGAFIDIPSHAEVKAIDPVYAKRRADADDELWVARMNGTFTQSRQEMLLSPIEGAKQQDLTEAKQELSEKIQQASVQQSVKFDNLQEKFSSSVKTIETVLQESQTNQDKLTVLGDKLGLLEQDLTAEIEHRQLLTEQLNKILSMTQAQLEMAQARELEESQSFDNQLAEFFKTTFGMIILSVVPALLVLFGAVYFLRKKNDSKTNTDEFLDSPSILNQDFSSTGNSGKAPSPSDDFLTDPMDDLNDALSDLDLGDSLDDAIELDSDDDLDLLGDSFDDDDLLSDDGLLSPDDDEVLLDEGLDLEDDVLSEDDFDGLLNEGAAEDLIPDLDDTTNPDDFDVDNVLNADDIEELLEQEESDEIDEDEILDTGVDDVDAIMNELGINTNEDDELEDDLGLDSDADDDFDIDDLLEAEAPEQNSEESLEELAEGLDDSEVAEDDFDIDDLLDAEAPVENLEETLEELADEIDQPDVAEDDFNIDDILDAEASDSNLEETLEELADEIEPADETDFDIDDLLDAEAPEDVSNEVVDAAETVEKVNTEEEPAGFDIDGVLENGADDDSQPDEFDIDDLLENSNADDNEPDELDIASDELDIDNLADSSPEGEDSLESSIADEDVDDAIDDFDIADGLDVEEEVLTEESALTSE